MAACSSTMGMRHLHEEGSTSKVISDATCTSEPSDIVTFTLKYFNRTSHLISRELLIPVLASLGHDEIVVLHISIVTQASLPGGAELSMSLYSHG